jgi:hypothetical protein
LLLLSTSSLAVAFRDLGGAVVSASLFFTPLQPAKTDAVTFSGSASGEV